MSPTTQAKRDPQRHAANNRAWEQRNPDWVRSRNKKTRTYYRDWERRQRKENLLYRLRKNAGNRLRMFVSTFGFYKPRRTQAMIGCTPDQLRAHLERLFKPGMSWANYGPRGWHIDHKTPLASAKTVSDFERLSHFTNLQPLWAKENAAKRDRILSQ